MFLKKTVLLIAAVLVLSGCAKEKSVTVMPSDFSAEVNIECATGDCKVQLSLSDGAYTALVLEPKEIAGTVISAEKNGNTLSLDNISYTLPQGTETPVNALLEVMSGACGKSASGEEKYVYEGEYNGTGYTVTVTEGGLPISVTSGNNLKAEFYNVSVK